MSEIVVFDTFVLFALYHKEKSANTVKEYLNKGKWKDLKLLLNEISLGEFYYRVWKYHGQENARIALSRVVQMPLEFVGVDREFILSAASWKGRFPISYADAFVVETAVRNKCPIVTGDPEFASIEEIEIIRL